MTTISISANDRVFVLTGAGISAESGLPTFRADDGLWAGHRVEDVCTPDAWRCESGAGVGVLLAASAHKARRPSRIPRIALAELEAELGDRFFLCTQNVDDLHERAGSTRLAAHARGAGQGSLRPGMRPGRQSRIAPSIERWQKLAAASAAAACDRISSSSARFRWRWSAFRKRSAKLR